MFGTTGTGSGEFSDPSWTAVNPVSGTVYVTDSTNDTVQAFSSTGTYQSTIGSSGSGNGEFTDPTGVAVDPVNGWVYVVDSRDSRVEFFTSSGVFLGQFGSSELSSTAQGIAIDPATADVYVADTGNQQIEEFNWDGGFIHDIGCDAVTTSCTSVTGGGFQTGSPTGVALDPNTGLIYAGDPAQHQIQVFTPSGNPDTPLTTVGLVDPSGIAVDPTNGDVYAVDHASSDVEVFPPTGTATSFGTAGSTTDEFNDPVGVAVAPSTGDVYVVDQGNRRVERFASATPTIAEPTCNPAKPLNANLITASLVTMTCTGPTGAGVTPFYEIVSQPAHGTLSGFDPYTGTVYYLPDPGYGGTDSFSFTATDDGGAGTPVSVAVTAGTAPRPLPTLSKISLKGVPGKKTAGLVLTANAAKGQPRLKTIKISLPGGFGFSKKMLARGLSVKSAKGTKLRFKFSLKGASLTIQLRSADAVAVVKLATGTIVLSKTEAKAISKARGKHVTAKLAITLINAKGTKTYIKKSVLAS